MTAKEAKSWLDNLTPGNWITIIIILAAWLGNYAVNAYQSAEAERGVKQNTKDIQDLKGDYKVIIERLNQSKETDARMEKKLDEILMERR